MKTAKAIIRPQAQHCNIRHNPSAPILRRGFCDLLASIVALGASTVAGQAPAWKVYTPGNTGLPGDLCYSMWIDEQDHPWIAGFTSTIWGELQGGLGYHDGDHWNAISNVDHAQIASPVFNDIVRDQNGVLWIGTDFGLLRLDRAAGAEGMVRYDHTNSPMLASQIVDVAVAPDNTIWLAIHDVDSVPSGGLARFNPAASQWQVWTAANGLPWGPQWPNWNWIDQVAIVPDQGGDGYTVWFTQQELGTGTYRNGQFTWFGSLPDIIGSNPPVPWRLPSDNASDSDGNLWLLMSNGTYARRDPNGVFHNAGIAPEVGAFSTASLTALSNGRAVVQAFGTNVQLYDQGWSALPNWCGSAAAFSEDSSGAIWVCGQGGAAKYEAGAWRRHRFTNSSMLSYFIEAIAFGAQGQVYINGNAAPGVGGFNIFDGTTWVGVNDFNYGFGPSWGLPSDDTQAFSERANGHVAIIPVGQAVYDWDGTGFSQLIPFGYDPVRVAEDGLGRLWAPRANGWGLLLIDGGTFTEFYPGNSPMPNGSEVKAVIPDAAQPGAVWLAHQLGLAYTNGVNWTMYSRTQIGVSTTDTGYVSCADRAADGSFWFGTEGEGVVQFDPATGQNTRYTAAGGALPTDFVTNIEIAPDGSVWVASMSFIAPYPGGLSHFENGAWTTYTSQNSPLPHNQNGCLASRPIASGYELWIGTVSEGLAVVTVSDGVPGDVDHDGDIDLSDLALLLSTFGLCNGDPGYNSAADFDGSGCVELTDLAELLSGFGT